VSFARLIDRFKQGVRPTDESRQSGHDPLRLATAAVLLDIAYADGTFTPAEDGNMVEYLRRAFALDDSAAQELIEAAAQIRSHTIDYFAITNYIRKQTALAERIDIVKTMWRMVYSDGRLTDYENYLVRKLADLLGLEHKVMIEAKVAVLRELGIAAD
jgi:uncharacterized tellurite resistance protein B-like protein